MTAPATIYAGRTERFFAFLLDQLIVILLQYTLFYGAATGIAVFGAFACQAAYYSLLIGGTWQASFGQRLLSIYIVKRNGQRLTATDALTRFLAYIIPALPLYTSLLPPNIGQALAGGLMIFWFLPILVNEDRSGFHDQLCGTLVVTGKVGGKK